MILELSLPLQELTHWLQEQHILLPEEDVLSIEKPGEGNMNLVIRVKTSQRSFIVKQAKPFVQKFKSIPAPINRIVSEAAFYKRIEGYSISERFPNLIKFIPSQHILVMEDLGVNTDFSFLYQNNNIDKNHLTALVSILWEIHQIPVPKDYPDNIELRRLNHEHIFVLPFSEHNPIDLEAIQEGLGVLASSVKCNTKLIEKVRQLGKLYMSLATEDSVLLHGDYYPGSWMKCKEAISILDPEFSFAGNAAFDLGVMIGHIFIITKDLQLCDELINQYPSSDIDRNLVKSFAGVEIIRRIIGVAQLPMKDSIHGKKLLLAQAEEWVLSH